MFKRKLIISILIILTTTPLTNAVISDRDLLFFNIINSPRAVGMGGATVNFVDAQSPLYNPGAYGVFSLDNNFSLSLPSNTNWFPLLDEDIRIKTWSIGGGYSKTQSNNFRYSIGLAYSNRIFDYGVYYINDPFGYPFSPFNPIDKADYFTIAIGLEYKVRIGIGYTLKKFSSDDRIFMVGAPLPSTATTGNLYDFGLFVEYDLIQSTDLYNDDLQLEVIPSFALVKSNLGDAYLPSPFGISGYIARIQRAGISLDINFKKNLKHIIKFKFVYEVEKDLVKNYNYYSGTGATEIIPQINRRGIEVGIFETIYFRTGKFEDENSSLIYGVNTSDYFYSSYGFGFSLRGLLTAFNGSKSNDNSSDAIGYIFKHIDMKFDWAKINKTSTLLNDTKFMKLSITI